MIVSFSDQTLNCWISSGINLLLNAANIVVLHWLCLVFFGVDELFLMIDIVIFELFTIKSKICCSLMIFQFRVHLNGWIVIWFDFWEVGLITCHLIFNGNVIDHGCFIQRTNTTHIFKFNRIIVALGQFRSKKSSFLLLYLLFCFKFFFWFHNSS